MAVEITMTSPVKNGVTIPHVRLTCPRCDSANISQYGKYCNSQDEITRHFNCDNCLLRFKTREFIN